MPKPWDVEASSFGIFPMETCLFEIKQATIFWICGEYHPFWFRRIKVLIKKDGKRHFYFRQDLYLQFLGRGFLQIPQKRGKESEVGKERRESKGKGENRGKEEKATDKEWLWWEERREKKSNSQGKKGNKTESGKAGLKKMVSIFGSLGLRHTFLVWVKCCQSLRRDLSSHNSILEIS
jgi:hypothetical protein